MNAYFVDVEDESGQKVQSFKIFAGTREIPGGTVGVWKVRVFLATGSYDLYLNGPNLMTMDTNETIGTLIGFNFDLKVGAAFQVKYFKTKTFNAKIKDIKDEPNPNSPQKPTPVNVPDYNPNMPDITQPVIDYVNKQNQQNQ